MISVLTAGVLPPRDVDKLLDVTNLLWLHKNSFIIDCRHVEGKECTYHGAEQIWCLEEGRRYSNVGIV
jgi:hypothetical protein